MNFFHHKDLGNHLLQLCPKVVKHPVYDEKITVALKQDNKECKKKNSDPDNPGKKVF